MHVGTCVGGKGPNLSGFPGLTYAPQQHGEGIRFAHNGVPVEEALADPAMATAVATLDGIAAKLGVKLPDVCDAVGHARTNGVI